MDKSFALTRLEDFERNYYNFLDNDNKFITLADYSSDHEYDSSDM